MCVKEGDRCKVLEGCRRMKWFAGLAGACLASKKSCRILGILKLIYVGMSRSRRWYIEARFEADGVECGGAMLEAMPCRPIGRKAWHVECVMVGDKNIS